MTHPVGLYKAVPSFVRLRTTLLCTCAALMFNEAAIAQQAPQANGSQGAVETVEVTAQKRVENIQDVPLSVTAFSGQQLSERQVYDFTDLAQVAPGAIFEPGHVDTANIEMRGSTIASTAPAVDSGVSVYVDDVPTIGVQELNQQFFDLDRIEVLRGPQGTVFGRNVTGGLISIHTLDPSFTPDLKLTAGYGDYNDYRVGAYISGPLSDTVAGNFSIGAAGHDGYQHDVISGGDFGGENDVSGRTKILYQPNSDLRVVIGADFYHETGSAGSSQLLSNTQPNLVLAQYPTLSYKPSDTNTLVKGTASVNNFSLTGHVDWTTGIGTFTSITGYRAVNNRENNQANVGDPLGDFQEYRDEPDTQFTEEARLASPANQSFRWLVGGFFLNSNSKQDFPVNWNYTMFPVCSAAGEPAFGFYISLFNGCTSNQEIGDFSQHVHLENEAVFGQLEYDLAPRLTVSIGARESWETRSGYNYYSELHIIFGPSASVPFSLSSNNFTPKYTITYKPTESFMLYVTADKGFKGAGQDIFSGLFPMETAWNYEAGWKSTLFDGRAVVNASLFDQKYNNMQLRDFDPSTGLFVTGTVSRATVKGIESEIVGRPVDWLTVGGSWTYQEPTQDAGGLDLQQTPRQNLNLYAQANWAAPELHGAIVVGGDITFKSTYWSTNANNDPNYVHQNTAASGLLNLHAEWISDDDAWNVTLWGKNVTNQRYLTFAGDVGEPYYYSAATTGHMFAVFWNNPATFGVTATYHMR